MLEKRNFVTGGGRVKMLDRELEQVTERAEGRKGFVWRPWWRPPMDLDGWMTAQGARPIADFNGGKERKRQKSREKR